MIVICYPRLDSYYKSNCPYHAILSLENKPKKENYNKLTIQDTEIYLQML
jgi:hypothetical protein